MSLTWPQYHTHFWWKNRWIQRNGEGGTGSSHGRFAAKTEGVNLRESCRLGTAPLFVPRAPGEISECPALVPARGGGVWERWKRQDTPVQSTAVPDEDSVEECRLAGWDEEWEGVLSTRRGAPERISMRCSRLRKSIGVVEGWCLT